MRTALSPRQRFQPTSTVFSLPSPTGGWNRRDNLAAMPPLDAITMDNVRPDVTGVTLRRGDELFADTLSGEVETLIEFRSPTQTQFLAAAGSVIYEITSGGAGVSRGTGFTNARWETENYNGHLFFANGEDIVQDWDGSTLGNATFTGVTLSDLDNVAMVRDRLWFVEKDTASAWHGPLGGITGALVEFEIGQVARKGHLVAVAPWSRDTGSGMDDFTVFIMSGGDIVVYEGDPATTITKIGLYHAPEPIGKRCWLNIGGELIILTRGGYMPLSALVNGQFSPEETLSEKIRDAVSDAVSGSGDLFGWEGVNHPDGIHTIFNVPVVENDEYDQHVLNNITGAWGRDKERNGNTFAEFDDNFYMGVLDKVFRVDQGGIDESRPANWEIIEDRWDAWGLVWGDGGSTIEGFCIQASNSLDQPNRPLSGTRKQVTNIRPFVKGGGTIPVTFGVFPDFMTGVVPANRQIISPAIVPWEEESVQWNFWEQPWGEGTGVAKANLSANADGFTFSVFAAFDTAEDISWYNTDIIYRQGGLL